MAQMQMQSVGIEEGVVARIARWLVRNVSCSSFASMLLEAMHRPGCGRLKEPLARNADDGGLCVRGLRVIRLWARAQAGMIFLQEGSQVAFKAISL